MLLETCIIFFYRHPAEAGPVRTTASVCQCTKETITSVSAKGSGEKTAKTIKNTPRIRCHIWASWVCSNESFSLSHWSRTWMHIRTVMVKHGAGLCPPCEDDQQSISMQWISSISRGINNANFTSKMPLFSCSRHWRMFYCKRVSPEC